MHALLGSSWYCLACEGEGQRTQEVPEKSADQCTHSGEWDAQRNEVWIRHGHLSVPVQVSQLLRHAPPLNAMPSLQHSSCSAQRGACSLVVGPTPTY